MIFGYIRQTPELEDIENQKKVINEYCDDRKWYLDKFLCVHVKKSSKSKDGLGIESTGALEHGDTLIVSSMGRFGRSITENIRTCGALFKKGVRVIFADNNIDLNPIGETDERSRIYFEVWHDMLKFDFELRSLRTKDAHAIKKYSVTRSSLKPKSSKLDKYHDEILELSANGMNMKAITIYLERAYSHKMSYEAIQHWMRRHKDDTFVNSDGEETTIDAYKGAKK